MNILRPWFQEGIHWRKLTANERNGRPWKYKTIRSITVRFERRICFGRYCLYDGDGNLWGVIEPNSITVAAGYAWNGSSFSPDLPGVLLASLVHDLLYQFSGCEGFPFSRMFCDDLFYALAESPFSPIYRLGLFIGGWACWGKIEPGAKIKT
jgi:hypothetical protein